MNHSRWATVGESDPLKDQDVPHKATAPAAPVTPGTVDTADAQDAQQFAQTREPDNLFEDDFTPIAPIAQATAETRQQDASLLPVHKQSARGAHGRRARGASTMNHTNENRRARQPHPNASRQAATGANEIAVTTQVPEEPVPGSSTEQAPEAADDVASPNPKATVKPSLAVRGDRSKTGGVVKPKLTEEELTAKMANVRLINQKREEAHRLAEADEASFKAQEALAVQKRKEETQSRRQMEMEREKNRMRKMAGRGGREWDESKEENLGFERGRGSTFRRGAYGGVARNDTPATPDYQQDQLQTTDSNERGGFRGRGYRGGRGRGRGSEHFATSNSGRNEFKVVIKDKPVSGPSAPPVLNTAQFPALEPATQLQQQSVTERNLSKIPSLKDADDHLARRRVDVATWAEQVEEGLPV